MSRETSGRGGAGGHPQPAPQSWGAAWGQRGRRRRVPVLFCSLPRQPAASSWPRPPPAAPSSATRVPRDRALSGRGDPEHRRRWGCPWAPGPSHVPTSAAGPRQQRATSRPCLVRDSRGSQPAPASHPAGAGRGRAPPPPRDWRPE